MVIVLAGVSGHTQKKDAVEKAALRSLIVVLVLMVIMQLLCSFPHGHHAVTMFFPSWSSSSYFGLVIMVTMHKDSEIT